MSKVGIEVVEFPLPSGYFLHYNAKIHPTVGLWVCQTIPAKNGCKAVIPLRKVPTPHPSTIKIVIKYNKVIAIVKSSTQKIIAKSRNHIMELPYNLNLVKTLLKSNNMDLIEIHTPITVENLLPITAHLKISFFFPKIIN